MAKEIERKFLVDEDGWLGRAGEGVAIRQFYVAAGGDRSVRVRQRKGGATLTLKFGEHARERDEFEYEVSPDDAREMAAFAVGVVVEKTRHLVPHAGHVYEVDVFAGSLAGLVIAELETPDEVADADLPAWLGREITGEAEYYNASLALNGMPRPGAMRIDPSRPFDRELVRNALAQADAAIASLGRASPENPVALHEARKAIKKLRALLGLARAAAPGILAAEARRFRDAARPIAAPREAGALVETMDRLIAEFPGKVAACRLADIRAALAARHARLFEDRADLDAAVAAALQACGEGRAALRALVVGPDVDPAEVLARGVKRNLARGRKALVAARNRAAPEDFHALRKTVKAHWAHLGLLRNVWPGKVGKRRAAAERLGEDLGELNDIHVMRAEIAAGTLGLPEGIDTGPFDRLLKSKAKALSRQCIADAEKLLSAAPRNLQKTLAAAFGDAGAAGSPGKAG